MKLNYDDVSNTQIQCCHINTNIKQMAIGFLETNNRKNY